MSLRPVLCLAITLLSGATLHAIDPVKVVILDGSAPGRTFDGIGALSAGASSRLLVDYPEPYRSRILDYLFKPGYGASLQHLKVEVGGDVNSTDGSEPSHMRSRGDRDYTRGYEWWLMKEARKRNPAIILDSLPWGAPGWVGKDTIYTPEMAAYMADFIRGALEKQDLDVAYTGIWNEKHFDATYIKALHKALQEAGLRTKIVCCDQYPEKEEGQWSIIDAMRSDAELRSAVDVVGVHYPQERGKLTTPEAARALGKPLWSSEDQPNSGSGPIVSRDWKVGGRILSALYNRNYLEGAMTKTEIWSPVTSYYDILAAPNSGLMYANTPWSGHYDVQSTIWVTAHTTQFAQPGWRYLDTGSGYLPEKGTYVALRSPGGVDWSVILETTGADRAQPLEFKIQGGLSAGAVHVWQTNAQRSFEHVADLTPESGHFAYTFESDSIYSLTTTSGQGKGSAAAPPASSFPLPYREDFEQTALSRAPRFLSDQDGAFEAQPCAGRPGRCLEQVIVDKPIPWGPLPDPFTLAGDAGWTDYGISAQIHLHDAGAVTLMARIDSSDVFQDGKALYPSGYIVSLAKDGGWKLLCTQYKKPTAVLASGRIGNLGEGWHRMQLETHGTTISFLMDAKKVAKVIDTTHPRGMFGIGTGWNRAQFDDLAVEPN